MDGQGRPIVLVIGAGPAGLYGAQRLVKEGARVVVLNRDVKPGGLAEYGIYYDKYKVKVGLRKQFGKILDAPEVTYYGNVTVAEDGDLRLCDVQALGFDAVLVTVGAQGTKWLGLPGEELEGVYHAKDVIYFYNRLPPYSEMDFAVGKRVALIGVGNVMADIAHWLTRDIQVDEVVAVARRGPAEVKFARRELQYVGANLDVDDLDTEIDRVAERMRAVQQDPEAAKAFILSAQRRAPEPVSETRVRFRFLSSPKRIVGDGAGRVAGLEVDNTRLIVRKGHTLPADGTPPPIEATKAERLGTQEVLDVDTVIFCIGDKVSDTFGLPVEWNAFVKHPEPRYPVEGVCYEVYDPEAGCPIEGVFVAGWAREASFGQVGLARRDAQHCVQAMAHYWEERSVAEGAPDPVEGLEAQLAQLNKPVVTKEDWARLSELEQQEAEARGVEDFKFKSNAEMLEALGLG